MNQHLSSFFYKQFDCVLTYTKVRGDRRCIKMKIKITVYPEFSGSHGIACVLLYSMRYNVEKSFLNKLQSC